MQFTTFIIILATLFSLFALSVNAAALPPTALAARAQGSSNVPTFIAPGSLLGRPYTRHEARADSALDQIAARSPVTRSERFQAVQRRAQLLGARVAGPSEVLPEEDSTPEQHVPVVAA